MKRILFAVTILSFLIAGCSAPIGDDTTTQDLPEWKTDGVILMQSPETGQVNCFGCSGGLCADPVQGLEVIEETEEQHCTGSFDVVGAE